MRADTVEDLRDVAGRWVLCATTRGYFDHHPNVEQANLEYRVLSEEEVAFDVRFRVGRRERGFTARQSAFRGQDGYFRFRGTRVWMRVARINWDMMLDRNREILVAANAGSLISPSGLMVFVRDGVDCSRVRNVIAVSPRDFGITPSQHRLLRWRSEGDRLAFRARR